jgi:hypothetical protein
MAQNNQVGFVSFSTEINKKVPINPLRQSKWEICDAVDKMRAQGGTALYDAIVDGIRMTDTAPGAENSIRAVVVLTDGRCNEGTNELDNIIKMMSREETIINQFCGMDNREPGIDELGRKVKKEDIIGFDLEIVTTHDIQIFFIGIGGDADIEVGRILSEGTGAEYQGVTEGDLANIMEEFSKYF